MDTNHTPTRPSPTQELSRLTARVAELEAALRDISDNFLTYDETDVRRVVRAALAQS